MEICCEMSTTRIKRPSSAKAKHETNRPPLAEMLTPSELDRLRRSTQEADTYLKTAFKNHNVNLKTD